MGFSCGIVGLPNVGKSTLFNALTSTAAAESANYPFTTIEPNVGRVAVPDPRLTDVARLAHSGKTVPTYLDFVDIAGLVHGAHRGEGLGNQFLSHVREVDCIAHVLRCFDGTDVSHVDGRIDPVADAQTIETELQLADSEILVQRRDTLEKHVRTGEIEVERDLAVVSAVQARLDQGSPVRGPDTSAEERHVLRGMNLLTAKPVLFVCNVDETGAVQGNAYSRAAQEWAYEQAAPCVIISAQIEAELMELENPQDRAEYLEGIGLEETGLSRLITAGYTALDLVTFFTANEKEAHAWTVPRATPAPVAAGRIHTDFERGFIRAETVAFEQFLACSGEQGTRDAGKMRSEGKEYVVQDGDVIQFRFNV